MDAKPQRPVRTAHVKHDENLPQAMPLSKTIHQRNKSSPALSTMLGAGGLKAAAKRTAFGDVSNITNTNRPSKDDTAITTKEGLDPIGKPVQQLQERKSAAFLRPAQRPLSVSGLKGLLTGSSSASTFEAAPRAATAENVATSQTANTRKILTKRNTTIFRDISLDTIQEAKPASEASQQVPTTARTNNYQPSEPQLYFPAPTHQLVAIEDPIKESPRLNSEAILPGISEVSLHVPASSGETNIQEVVKVDPVVGHEHGNIIASLRQTDFGDALQAPTDTQAANASLSSAGMTEAYVPQALKSLLPSQTIPPLLPHLSQATAYSEPEENWDDEEEEPYEEEGYVTARSYRSKGENTTGGATTVLFPQMNQRVRREISAAKRLVEVTRSPEEIEDESYDTSMVAEYGDEIFDYMKSLEVKMLPNAHYMDNQHEIQWSMRAVLMDWLVQVHHRFNLLPETLFLCVNYIDRFLSCKVVSLGKLQLVGATAIFIAAKYEEINCPSVQEIVYMVDGGYTIDEILKAERFMLTMLQFELGWPGPMSFLRRISKADDYDLETRTLAKYFLEVTIMDERFIGSPPSFAAAASHCLARMMLHKGTWSPHHVYYSNYTYSQLRPLLALLLECCEEPRKHHAAVYNKYCDKRYKRASAFVESEMQRGFTLPGTPVIKDVIQPQLLPYYDGSYFRM